MTTTTATVLGYCTHIYMYLHTRRSTWVMYMYCTLL